MNATLFFDSVLTVLLSLALVGVGGLTLWLLPWSDAERAGTVRGFGVAARHVGEVAGRPRSSFRVAPTR